jgi:hypothetical protein
MKLFIMQFRQVPYFLGPLISKYLPKRRIPFLDFDVIVLHIFGMLFWLLFRNYMNNTLA